MKKPPRRPYQQVARARATDALRERIVRAFFALLMKKWLDEVTLDEVAAAAETLSITALAPRYPELKLLIARGRSNHRCWLSEVLSPWLAGFDAKQEERVLCECLIATDTYTWRLLRRDFGKSITETEATIADLLRKALRLV